MAVTVGDTRLKLEGRVWRDKSLASHTSFRIGGPAAIFVQPASVADVEAALDFAKRRGLPWYVLGNGTNTLFPDAGFPGVVIHLGPGGGLNKVALAGDRLRAEAGASLAAVGRACEGAGVRALDFLVGIPAAVGGAVAMNAGIPEAAIGDAVTAVTVLDDRGKVRTLDADACAFGYRDSRIRHDGLIVLSAELCLDRQASWDKPALLARRNRQPLGYSPGCVFKNPPHFPHSAGWLIDKSGLKGHQVGNAQVSRSHGNFILNRGKALYTDVLTLIDIVREKVYKEFNLELNLELEVV